MNKQFKVTDSTVTWVDLDRIQTRSYGFVNGQLMFVVRPPEGKSELEAPWANEKTVPDVKIAGVAVSKATARPTFIVHDLVHDEKFGASTNIGESMAAAAIQLRDYYLGKEVFMSYWKIAAPVHGMR